MTVQLCKDYGLGYLGQPWAGPGPGSLERSLCRLPDIISATGRTPQRTALAGIGAHLDPGRGRAAEHHGPPAAGPFGTWAVSWPRNLRAIASTRGPAGRRDPHGPWPVAGRESCEPWSSWDIFTVSDH
jgi:hypothetical protein